jgi:hypothetical protein
MKLWDLVFCTTVSLGAGRTRMGALDRRARLRQKKKVAPVDYVRLEKDGKIKYVRNDGTETLMVPSVEACKKRLIDLLDEVGGDKFHKDVAAFWRERSKDCGSKDAMSSAWANETYDRLEKAWDEITTPPTEDFFAEFDL